MDECNLPCCGVSPRRSVSALFDRGYRRARLAPLASQGEPRRDGNGFTAQFSLAVEDGAIEGVGFRASTCVTLVAYCELVAELAAGQTVADAARLSPAALISELEGVPPAKRDRAFLAIGAFRNALAVAWNAQSPNQPTIGESHEGRLHLRHAAP